jgi:hypothetical protein
VRRTAEEDGHSTLVLVPEGKTLLCRLEVIHGQGLLADAEVEAFLEMARQDFRGANEQPAELGTKVGTLRGFAVRRAVKARSRAGQGEGESEIQVYAGTVGRDLLAAIAGGWSKDPDGRKLAKQCLGALRSIRESR